MLRGEGRRKKEREGKGRLKGKEEKGTKRLKGEKEVSGQKIHLRRDMVSKPLAN